jgi:hypothetical protein
MRALDLIRLAGYSAPIVDPIDIAQKIGLRVVPFDFDEDISGVLVLSGSKRVIDVNKKSVSAASTFLVLLMKSHVTLKDT